MFDGAIVIDGRSVRRAVRELGIRCDDKEIPEPIDDIKPQGWWIVADCSFHGTAWTRNQAGVRNGTVTVDVQTPAAFVVAGGRLAAILSPMATTEPALWLVTAASTLRQEAQGAQGLRHRPGQIDLHGDGWQLRLRDVSRLFRHTQKYQTGQEASLLEALGVAAKQPVHAPAAANAAQQATSASPEDERGRTWVKDSSLGGLYRLHLDGAPASATALVDRELPRGEQMRALASLDWPPPRQLSAIFDATEHGMMPKPYSNDLAGNRLVQPFLLDHGAIADIDEPPSEHPVYRYLWPTVSVNGDLVLDPGETVSYSWSSQPPSQATILSSGKRGSASTYIPDRLQETRCYLTDRRLAVIGKIDTPPIAAKEDYSLKLALVSPVLDELRATVRQVRRLSDRNNLWWAAHFRYEWIDEIGVRTRTAPSRKGGLFAKPGPSETTESFYARLRVPHGATCELSFPQKGSGYSSAAELVDRCAQLITHVNADRRLEAKEPETREYNMGGNQRSVEVDAARTIHGAVPYSLPTALR